jgi:hypothetical protein
MLDPNPTHIHVQVDNKGTVPVQVKSPPLALGLFGILFVLCVQVCINIFSKLTYFLGNDAGNCPSLSKISLTKART